MKPAILRTLHSIILLFIFISCKDYSDLELFTKTKWIDLNNPIIEAALVGKEKITGTIKIKFNEESLSEGKIESHLDREYSSFKLNFTELNELNAYIASKLVEVSTLSLQLVFINEKSKVKIEKSIQVETRIPPISNIIQIDGTNFEKTVPVQISKQIINLRKQNIRSDDLNKAALISYILSNGNTFLESTEKSTLKKVLKGTDKIRVKLTVDTVYYKSVIGRYPISKNKIYEDINFEKTMSEYISNGLNDIKSDYNGKKIRGNYIIEDVITAKYSGEIGLYLINIDENNNYFIQQFGTFLSDDISPKFSNYSFCSFDGDSKIEGLVCLDTKHFYGYSPYNVPFVGYVYGDVAKLYVNNKYVSFTTGEELYFKKRVYLDGGYNRIPVKIMDKKGNTTDSFIPITIESLDKPDIDIDIDTND